MQLRWIPTCLAVLALSASLSPAALAAYNIPPNDGFVTDEAAVLTAQQESQLEQILRQYQQTTSNEIAIFIINSLEGNVIADLAVEVGRAWGVGTKEYDNGILILVSYTDRELFIATGYGLEGAVPDIVAHGVIESDILPLFREGQYFEGLLAGIEALQKHIGGEYTAERYQADASTQSRADWFTIGMVVLVFFSAIASLVESLLLGMAPSRIWWPGGVVGFFFGVLALVFTGWWLGLVMFVLAGLLIDFTVSTLYERNPLFQRWVTKRNRRTKKRGGWWGGGGFGGGFGSGGGGGFSGGSFGGGGAGGRW